MAPLESIFKEVGKGFLDSSAQKKSRISWRSDLLLTAGTILTAAVSYLDSVQKLFVGIVGEFSGTLRLLMILMAFVGCVVIIYSKEKRSAVIYGVDDSTQYSYAQPLRWLAKLGMVAVLILMPSRIVGAVDDFLPLPKTIYGYLVNAANGRPVASMSIRIVAANDVDATEGIWLSDSDGFYIVRAREHIKRSAWLSVEGTCGARARLKLRRVDQIGIRNDIPVFRHVITCGGTND